MTAGTMTAQAIVRSLAGLHEQNDDKGEVLDKRVAAYWGGQADEEVAWLLSMANMVCAEPVAQRLYLAHVAEDFGNARAIKEWAYRVAVEFVGSKGGGQRKRSMVESYRLDWGHQCARDGVALALWPHLAKDVTGIAARADLFKCGKQAYGRVRDAVENRTADLIAGFRFALKWAHGDIYSHDLVQRWEAATGNQWKHGPRRSE